MVLDTWHDGISRTKLCRMKGVLPTFRRLRAAGAIAILAAWVYNTLGSVLSDMLHEIVNASLVEAVAIEAPELERHVCHHHPHGCPKDCFCPKLTVVAENTGGPVSPRSQDTLSEPSLEQCTELAHGMVWQFAALVLPEPPWVPIQLELKSNWPSARVREPLDPFQDPPRKIPIA